MLRMKWLFTFIIILGLIGSTIATCTTAWGRGEIVGEAVGVSLESLQTTPHVANKKKVIFTCRFAMRGSLFRKVNSVFSADDYDNFSVWGEGVNFWEAEAADKILPTLYIPRENAQQYKTINRLGRYARIQIVGTVREVYANLPWIEVEEIRLLDNDGVNDAMVMQIARALKFQKTGEMQKAKICYELALENGAPEYIASFVNAKIATLTSPVAVEKKIKVVNNLKTDSLEAARGLVARKNNPQAARAYRLALVDAKNSMNASVLKEVGNFFLDYYNTTKNSEHLESAEYFFNKVVELGADDSVLEAALYKLAYVAYLSGTKRNDFKKAEARLRACLAKSPAYSPAQKLLSQILSDKLSISQEVVAVAPKKRIELSASQHFNLGKELLRNGNAQDAARHLENALKVDGAASREARVLLASALLALGEGDKAKGLLSVAAGMPVGPHEIKKKTENDSEIDTQTTITPIVGDLDSAIKEIAVVKNSLATLSDEPDEFMDSLPPLSSGLTHESKIQIAKRAKPSPVATKSKDTTNVDITEVEMTFPDFPEAKKQNGAALPEWAM